MSDHSQDDLNKFFKSKLTNATPAENGWNVPPKEVFFDAIAEVNDTRSRRNRYIFIIILFFLTLLLGSFFLYKTNNYIETIENKVVELEKQLTNKNQAEYNNKIPDVEITKVDQSAAKSKRSVVQDQGDKELLINKFKTKKSADDLFNRSENTIDDTREDYERNIAFNADKLVSPTILNAKNAHLSYTRNEATYKSFISLEHISVLDRIPPSISLNERIGQLELGDYHVLDQHFTVPSKWSLVVFAKQNNTCLSMSNITNSSDIELTDYDNRYRGYGLDLRLDYAFNSFWSMSFVTSIDKYKSESNFYHRSRYNSSNEHTNTDGSTNYATDVFIMTPLGSYTTSANFAINANQYSSEDWLENQTNILQELSVFSSGLTVNAKVPFVASSKISFGTGLMYNRIIYVSNQMETTMSMNKNEMAKMDSSPEVMDDTSKDYVSFLGEVVVEKEITPYFDLLFGVQFNRSISSLRNIHNGIDPDTYLHNIGFNIGSRINF